MKGKLAIAVAFALALCTASAAVARSTTTGWIVTNDNPGVKTLRRGGDFNFLDLFTKRYLTNHGRLGADTGLDVKTPRNVTLGSRGMADPIRCGDLFSISVDGAFLVYDRREPTAPHLGLHDKAWLDEQSVDPHQWKVASCKDGELVVLGKPIALVNVRRVDALVGCRRIYGAPYCWDDQQVLGQAKD